MRPSASLCCYFRRRSISPSIPFFPCRMLTPGLPPSRERPVPQTALGSLPCPTLTSDTPRAVVAGFPMLNETRSHALALFRVARHSLVFSGSPPGSLRCAVHSRSAARRQLHFGEETPSSPLVPPPWSLTTSATYSATYPLQRPCSPCSEEHSERRPKTPLVASLPACRAEARQPFIGRAHRVGLIASRLPSWGSLHFTPRTGSHGTSPCSPARIRDDLLGHQLGCPTSVDPSRGRPCVGLSRRLPTPSPARWPGPNRQRGA